MRLNRARLRLELRRALRPAAWVLALYALAAVAAIGMLSRQVFISPLKHYERVVVAFDRADGVVAGKTEVRISGVAVGTVEEKRLVDGRPRLTLALDDDIGAFYRDATAHVSAISPLEDMYVELGRGHRAAGRLGRGDVIAASQSGSDVHPADVLNAFGADHRARLATLLRELGRGLPDGGVRLRTAFGRLAPLMRAATDVTTELGRERRELARLVHSLAQATGTLAARDDQLATLVRDGNATLGALAGADTRLDATLRRLPGTVNAVDEAMRVVAPTLDTLDPALRALRPVARALPDGLDALKGFAVQARPALTQLRLTATRLSPLAKTLRRTSTALGGATSVLNDEIDVVDALTATAARCLEPLEAFFNRFLSANKLGSSKGTWWRNQLVLGADAVGVSDPGVRRIDACSDGMASR